MPSSNYPLIPLFVLYPFDFCLLRFFFFLSLPAPTVRCMRSGYRAVDSELRAGIWNQPPGLLVRKLVHSLAYLPRRLARCRCLCLQSFHSLGAHDRISAVVLFVHRSKPELPLVALKLALEGGPHSFAVES